MKGSYLLVLATVATGIVVGFMALRKMEIKCAYPKCTTIVEHKGDYCLEHLKLNKNKS